MSKGPGRLQLALIAAFDAAPQEWLNSDQLASVAYPGVEIEFYHIHAVNRALRQLVSTLGLEKRRAFPQSGWRYVYRKGA